MDRNLHDRNEELHNTGTSQGDRIVAALDPNYFRIDALDMDDFVRFAVRFGEQITYYGTANKPVGDWSALFANDTTVKLILIRAYDTESVARHYRDLTAIMNDIDSDSIDKEFLQATGLIYEQFQVVEDWYGRMGQLSAFSKELSKLISNRLQIMFTRFLDEISGAWQAELFDKHPGYNSVGFSRIWTPRNTTPTERHVYRKDVSRTQSIRDVLPRFHEVIDEVLTYVEVIRNSAGRYLTDELENKGKVQPHISLFLGFYEAYKVVQKELNGFTKRHLDHYYRDLLKFDELPPEPDQMHVVFELAQNNESVLLEEGTPLLAGTDDNGNDLIYRLNRDFVVNAARVSEIRALIQDTEKPLGNPLPDFQGEKELYFIDKTRRSDLNEESEEHAGENRLGFACMSNILRLDEGDRLITFNLQFDQLSFRKFESTVRNMVASQVSEVDSPYLLVNELLSDVFHLKYYSEDGWFEVPPAKVEVKIREESESKFRNHLEVMVLLDPVDPPVMPCDDETFTEAKDHELPVFKFLINPARRFLFDVLNDLIIDQVEIQVDLLGVRNLKLQNDYGVIDPNSPFEPFGPLPVLGNTFYIGHDSLFNYEIRDLKVNIEWFDLPADRNGFVDYYREYGQIESNQDFMALLSVLHNKRWYPAEDRQVVCLFQDVADDIPEDVMNDLPDLTRDTRGDLLSSVRRINNIDLNRFGPAAATTAHVAEPTIEYDRNTLNGYLKLELVNPPMAFGHKLYPEIMTRTMTESLNKKNKETPKVPNEPYTPVAKQVSLNISVSQTLDFRTGDREDQYGFYHLHPFGVVNVYEDRRVINPKLLPSYEFGIYLHIGVTNFKAPQTLSLLIQLDESGTENYNRLPQVEWSYLHGNYWQSIPDEDIVFNTTQGLTQSGIVGLKFDEIEVLPNNLLPDHLFWIRAFVPIGARFFRNIVDVRAQAVGATLDLTDAKVSYLDSFLPANAVTGLQRTVPEVNSVSQPYRSFGGRSHETTANFYQRVSERLRHKDRAQNIWDYEHMVLQAFPYISRVKCLSHVNHQMEMSPGSLTLVAVPFFFGDEDREDIEPRLNVGQLEEVRSFLESRASAFADIQVRNPLYEPVQVITNVRFRDGLDEGFFINQLNDDLRRLLSPWLFEKEQQVIFGETIHGSYILKFIEDLDYVDFVTNFGLYHYSQGKVVNQDDARETDVEVVPTSERSVLISATRHYITASRRNEEVDDGIEQMIVETDFMVFSEWRITDDVDGGLGRMKVGTDLRVWEDTVKTSDKEDFVLRIKR